MGAAIGNVERPTYKVLYKLSKGIEIREYGKRITISTSNKDDSKTFMKLAGYIGVGSKA